jgi:hypothetical protein
MIALEFLDAFFSEEADAIELAAIQEHTHELDQVRTAQLNNRQVATRQPSLSPLKWCAVCGSRPNRLN